MRPFLAAVLVVSGALLAPLDARAQLEPFPEDEMTRQELLAAIQEQFTQHLARELQLTEEQRDFLGEVLIEFAEARRMVLVQRQQVLADVQALLRAPSGSPFRSEERARELIHEVRAIRELEEGILRREEDRLLEVMDPSQVLMLQYLRDQFSDRIRELGVGAGR